MKLAHKLLAFAILTLGASTPFAQAAWTNRVSGTTNVLNGVAWSGTQFVAVGRATTDGSTPATILTSPDGVTWTPRTANTNSGLTAVASSGTSLVAVGYAGTIVSSPDGVTWTARATGTTNALNGVTWTGTQWVAVGASHTILTSPDGVTWTRRIGPNTANLLRGVCANSSLIVIVGEGGYIESSPDGITWTSRSSGSGLLLPGVAWTGTKFVTLTQSQFPGTLAAPAITSPDGITWTVTDVGLKGTPYAVIWTGTQLVSTGQGGQIMTSPDGVTWTQRGSSGLTTANLNAVATTGTGNRAIVAVGGLANGGSAGVTILTSDESAVAGIRGADRTPGLAGKRSNVPGSIQGYRADGRVPVVTRNPVSAPAPAR